MEQNRVVMQEGVKSHQRLREGIDELRRRKREIALKLEERETVVAELSRARADVERTKQTIRNPSELRKELQVEKTVSMVSVDLLFYLLQFPL